MPAGEQSVVRQDAQVRSTVTFIWVNAGFSCHKATKESTSSVYLVVCVEKVKLYVFLQGFMITHSVGFSDT